MPPFAIRAATPADAAELARLLTALGHATTAAGIHGHWDRWTTIGASAIVAAHDDGTLLGAATLQSIVVLHRPRPVGRVTSLIVDERHRGAGIGRALMAEAERHLASAGCGLIEITSNLRRADAHRFYEGLGYERTSYRFGKTLP